MDPVPFYEKQTGPETSYQSLFGLQNILRKNLFLVIHPKFPPACKKTLYSILRYSQFQSPVTKLRMPTQIYFDQLFIYVNLYQRAKNQAISRICSGYIVD